MRYGYRLITLLLAAVVLLPDAYAQTFFTARLTPAQEPGGVTSDGSGTAALVLTDEGLRFFVTVDGLSGPVGNAHFHRAPAGTNGGVVRGIMDDFDGNTASGLWTAADTQPLTDELIADLMAGNLYLNVHTAANPGGEIRGQIHPTSGTGLMAMLTPEQATGDETSTAGGTAAMQLTDAGLLFLVTVDGLTDAFTNAHFHRAPLGAGGGVVRGIMDDFDGNTAFGLWTADDAQPLTDELIAALLTGDLYINVHTAANPGGEIRGQVLLAGGWGFSAALDAAQQPGNVTSDATGTGTFTLTEAGLVYHVTTTGLSGPVTGSHFHRAPAGANGGVVRGFTMEGSTASGVWRPGDEQPLTTELIRDLLAGNLYVNIHTAANPGGEIRGQVLLDEGTSLRAVLTAAQQPADVTSDGTGTAAMELTDEGLAFRVTVDGLSGPIGNAHFHNKTAGVNGGVVRGIMADFDGNTASGVWTTTDTEPLTDDMLAALLMGNLYLNIHTANNPGGEIRGQVYLAGGTTLRAALTPAQEPGGVTSDGTGTAVAVLTDAGLVYHLTATGLSGPVANAHFHGGPVGVNGGVVHGIHDSFEGNTAAGVWRDVTTAQADDLLGGGLYLNLHTAANAGGEIRGQVYVGGGMGAAVQLDPGQEPGEVTSDGTGTAALTLTDAGLVYDLTVTGLAGAFSNAHFHGAPPGVNGGVVHGIQDSFTGHTASGVWQAGDEQPLTNAQVDALLAGDIYLNIHTSAFPGGELRGQVRASGVTATGVEAVAGEVPGAIALGQNYPNPFNPATTFTFALPQATHAVVSVYDLLGRQVAVLVDAGLPAGEYRVTFDARGLSSGVYVYRLEADGIAQTRAMLLMK